MSSIQALSSEISELTLDIAKLEERQKGADEEIVRIKEEATALDIDPDKLSETYDRILKDVGTSVGVVSVTVKQLQEEVNADAD